MLERVYLQALQRLVDKNLCGKTPFVIAIENGSLKCVKYILTSDWLHRHVDVRDFINADSLKTTIDRDQLDIAGFLVEDTDRFAAIIQIQIDANGRAYNVLEYSIALKKPEFVRIFVSVRIPGNERELYRSYKYFLQHYNVAYSGSSFDQTPIQRMLTMVSEDELVILTFGFVPSRKWFPWFHCYWNNLSARMALTCPWSMIAFAPRPPLIDAYLAARNAFKPPIGSNSIRSLSWPKLITRPSTIMTSFEFAWISNFNSSATFFTSSFSVLKSSSSVSTPVLHSPRRHRHNRTTTSATIHARKCVKN